MPAATLARRSAYSACEIAGTWTGARGLAARLVGGKLAHRLRDLGRARHEEILLRGVEGHARDVGRGDAHDRAVEVVERVLGDDGGDLRSEAAGQVVLVHD